mmetsp:Transcript_10436/g.31425  ORF Transcript_10436/g.31425 Transcript_10436/m.31425 type:complete len:299 (-) Transcript_10436:3149-4045(-)
MLSRPWRTPHLPPLAPSPSASASSCNSNRSVKPSRRGRSRQRLGVPSAPQWRVGAPATVHAPPPATATRTPSLRSSRHPRSRRSRHSSTRSSSRRQCTHTLTSPLKARCRQRLSNCSSSSVISRRCMRHSSRRTSTWRRSWQPVRKLPLSPRPGSETPPLLPPPWHPPGPPLSAPQVSFRGLQACTRSRGAWTHTTAQRTTWLQQQRSSTAAGGTLGILKASRSCPRLNSLHLRRRSFVTLRSGLLLSRRRYSSRRWPNNSSRRRCLRHSSSRLSSITSRRSSTSSTWQAKAAVAPTA